MVWNKTPDETIVKIQNLLHDFTLRYEDIAKLTGVSPYTVYQICSKMSAEFKAARYSGINRTAKIKSNPMKGKIKEQHHNAVRGPTKAGDYLAVWAPNWWTGPVDGNRVLMHQVVWAEANGQTEIPKGFVVHHKDHNKSNNSPDNLELFSRKDHAQYHAYHNYLERATTIPKREVEDSVLEAQSFLEKGR